MNAKVFGALFTLLLCGAMVAQQQNTGYATMTINGANGPPYPILTNVRTSTVAGFNFSGSTNQPYVVFQGPLLGVGSAFLPANNSLNSVDLALAPIFPVVVIDGFQYPVFSTDATGNGSFGIMLPNSGSPPSGIPIGLQLALQAFLADPFSTLGITLTAATRITVTQGPTVTNLSLGDENLYTLNVSANPIPYYGTNYTTLSIYANGYIIMGSSPPSDFIPSPSLFNSGPPRIAAFWTDLDQQSGTAVLTVDTPQGTPPNQTPGFVRVDYNNFQEAFGVPVTHAFSTVLKTDGNLEIIQPTGQNAATGYDEITGIGPGNNIGGSQPQQNFVGGDPDGAGSQTTGILTTSPFSKFGATNESFYEWFGNFTMPNYGNSYINNFDLFARTLHFLPNGSATTLPQQTSGYTLY